MSSEDIDAVRTWADRYDKSKRHKLVKTNSDGGLEPWYTDNYFMIPMTASMAAGGSGGSVELRLSSTNHFTRGILNLSQKPDMGAVAPYFRTNFFNELDWGTDDPNKAKTIEGVRFNLYLTEDKIIETELKIKHEVPAPTDSNKNTHTKIKLKGVFLGGNFDGLEKGDTLPSDYWSSNVSEDNIMIVRKIKGEKREKQVFEIKIVETLDELIEYMEKEVFVSDFAKVF